MEAVDGVRGVVWDLGNVLVDWDPRVAIAAGVGDAEAAGFLAADDVDFGVYNHGPDAGQSWDDAEAALAAATPHWLPHARAYRTHFRLSLVGEVPGTAALVRRLREQGVPQIGLTNWSHELYPHALDFDVVRLLDDVVVSGTEQLAKPDPAIYRLAAERIGLPPSALAFVDDKPLNVDAADAVGLHGLVFTGADVLAEGLRRLGLPV